MSLEHERTLCAQAILDNAVLDSDVLPEDFDDPFCHTVYKIMQGLRERRVPIDVISIRDQDQRILPDAIGNLAEASYSAANWKYYADEVMKCSRGRKLARIGKALQATAEADPDAAAEEAEKALLDLSHRGKQYDIASPVTYIPQWTKYFERISKAGGMLGVPTGFTEMDKSFGGFQGRRLYIVGGRPSDGKSAILLQFAIVGSIANRNIGIISAESAREEVYTRMVSHMTRIDGRRMVSGVLGERDQRGILSTLKGLSDANAIHIWDKPNPQVREVVSVARHMRTALHIDALLVDYIQLLQVKGARDRTEAAASASMALKQLSRELDIPVIAAAQLRRDDENRRPHLGSFQWADQLGQDADVAMLIWHKGKEQEEQESHILLEKVRDGKTCDIPVVFERDVVTFREKR
jgi:replicative DNA helicase